MAKQSKIDTIIKELQNASKMHLRQSKELASHAKDMDKGSPANKKRQRMIVEAFNKEESTVEDNSFKTQKLNDPKNVLDRKPTNKEYNKGYRTKKEKDGSVTIKGKKG